MIAVTGAGGFIGGRLVDALIASGRDDLLLVEREAGLERLSVRPQFEHLHADDLPRRLRRGDVEAVLHQGACSDTMEPNWSYVFRNNWLDNRRLLATCREYGVRLIYASSAAVYGHGSEGFSETPRCEAPLNVYGLSKQLFDLDVRRAIDAGDGPQVVGLRYFNVYGPGEAHKGRMASMVHQLREQVRTRGVMRLFEGSENFRRDFVSVDDAAKVNLFFLERPEISGIFNVGTGRAVTFMELAEAIRMRRPAARIETIPFPETLRGRYQAHTCADLNELRRVGHRGAWRGVEEGLDLWPHGLPSCANLKDS